MPHTGVIIRRNATAAISGEYLKLALEQNPTAWGAVIVTPEGLMTNSDDNPMDVEVLKDTEKDFAERNIYFYLCNSETAINMDDVSPFWLLEKDDNPLLVCLIEGQFPGHAKSGSSHPSEYHFVTDYLQPKINDLWELCDGDLTKLMAFLDKPGFKKEVMANANPRGAITFVAANGKELTFATGEGHCEYSWGWVSQNYGYALNPPKAEEKTEKKKSLFPNRSTVREKVTSTPVQHVAGPAPKTEAADVKNLFGVRKERPRSDSSRRDRKIFFQRRIGYCPIGWDTKIKGEYPEIECWFDKKTNQTVFISEVKKLGVEAIGVPVLNNPPRAEGKDTEPQNLPQTEPQQGPAVDPNVLPIVPPTSRKFVQEMLSQKHIKALIDEAGDIVSDPEKIQENEKKIVGFSEQTGAKGNLKDCATFCHMSFKDQKEWNQKDPATYDIFVRSLINYFLANEAKKGNKVTAEETHVVAQEELRPAKKSIFPQRRVA